MKREAIVEVLDFLNSIEGAGYGGMASFEIARGYVQHAYRNSLVNAAIEARNEARLVPALTPPGEMEDRG